MATFICCMGFTDLGMRLAYKVAYWGSGFHGYGRQPRLRTVEGAILDCLIGCGIIESPKVARFESASRTDRGVSALGNVIAFDASVNPLRGAALMNSAKTGIWTYAYAPVPEHFRPRRARERWYRYHFPEILEGSAVRDVAKLLVGTHDFQSFSKGRTRGLCEIRYCGLDEADDSSILDIKGDRFLWNMVRRIAGCLMKVSTGELSPKDVRRSLEGEPIPVSPAPPEGLWLMDIYYDFEFRPLSSKVVESSLRSLHRETDLMGSFLTELRAKFV